jgi:hypothetical protein
MAEDFEFSLASWYAQVLVKLIERIKTLVPEIRYIDQDLGQLEWYDIRPAVAFPCVLIDFNNTTYDQMQGTEQTGNAGFTLRLAFPQYSSSNSLTPDAVKEKALKYYEIENRLYKAIQGYDADGLMQPCTRVSAASERREEDNFRVRVMGFTTLFFDTEAAGEENVVSRPDLEIEQISPGEE